ncbi:RNA-directed DNA polymerase, eukaryota, reverse transcriptase zinc-binding domain protein [Tanacetum coccineum]
MATPVEKRNHAKFCEFHGEVGHKDECMHLKKQIEEMLKAVKLSHLIKELEQSNEKEQPKVAKKGETSEKDKAIVILMERLATSCGGYSKRQLGTFLLGKHADMMASQGHCEASLNNVWEGCFPVRQMKRGQAADRNQAIQEEVRKLVEAEIMKEHDVYMAVNHFFIHGEIPPGCNSSFIALIPKVPDANLVKDFRPISLIGSIYKIIAKILSNRLVNVLGDIVNEVQSAFIAERQMLDGPFILNEILQWCTKKKKKTLIFKVDFEKAFDSIRWDFLDDVLKEFGFRCKWRNWIQSCLTSSKGSILVNGCPTNEFQFYKGLKQGDPLSPFLFILVMESLHLSFQRIVNAGMFKGIVLDQSLCLSHMFYADDAIFLGEWSDGNISTLIHVLKCFFHASGLKINLNKSKIMGINVESAQVIQAAAKLGCLVLKCPFYYLGTRVGGSMTRVQAWQEIVEKVKSRLSKWKSKTLSIGGRLTLLKSVLGSIPVFHMSIFKVPSKVLHILESIRSHFFNGHDPGSKKASWVKWNNVLTDKKRGGLGVSSLFALNRGLMIKWVWKFLSQKDSLWTKVIVAIHGVGGKIHSEWTSTGKSCWLSILSEVRSLQRKGMYVFDYLTHKMGNGESTKFWLDHWHTRGIFKDIFPRLYALESSKDVTVSSKIGDTSLVCSFRRIPRGGIEQNQFDSLVELVRSVTIVPSADRWNWNLESTGIFSVASARRRINEICLPNIGEETRWVKCYDISKEKPMSNKELESKVEDMVEEVKTKMGELFGTYKERFDFLSSNSSMGEHMESEVTSPNNGDNDFLNDYYNVDATSSYETETELDRYLREPKIELRKGQSLDILQWWKVNGPRFPIVSKMARDILAIQISTVASEAAFSTGGRVLDPYRTRLSTTIVEALICTQDWVRKSRTQINWDDVEDLIKDDEIVKDMEKQLEKLTERDKAKQTGEI